MVRTIYQGSNAGWRLEWFVKPVPSPDRPEPRLWPLLSWKELSGRGEGTVQQTQQMLSFTLWCTDTGFSVCTNYLNEKFPREQFKLLILFHCIYFYMFMLKHACQFLATLATLILRMAMSVSRSTTPEWNIPIDCLPWNLTQTFTIWTVIPLVILLFI